MRNETQTTNEEKTMTAAQTRNRIAELKEQAKHCQELILNAFAMNNPRSCGVAIREQDTIWREIDRLCATL